MKKKALFIIIGIILLAIITATVAVLAIGAKYNLGVVTGVSISQKNDDTMNLRISYLLASGGYSVRTVSKDEGEYIGDGMVDYDGSIGKHRIIIEFGDLALAERILEKADENGVIELADGVWAKRAVPADHGFVLYIGSDRPISVEPIEQGKLNAIGGTIKIAVSVGEE